MNTAPLESLRPETLALLRQHNLLLPLVRAEVVKAAVESVPVSDEEKSELMTKYCKTRGLKSEGELVEHLKKASLSRSDLEWQVALDKRVEVYCKDQFMHKAEGRFLAKKERLDQVVYSLIRVKDPLLARELYLQISEQESDFGILASKYSQGVEQNTKGIIGPVSLSQAHPILAEYLRTTKSGVVNEPFQVEGWWLVARLERYEPARFDRETAMQMAREMFQEWVIEQSAVKIKEYSQNQD